MAGLRLQGIVKTYPNGCTAVRGIDLAVGEHEFVVLLGPSGCGKTTLLRIIAGLEETTEGIVAINDRTVNEVPPKERDVAMVFQNYALYPHMTVRENIAFPLQMRRLNRAEIDQRVRAVSSMLGISNVLLERPRTLSGGQAQRVAIARALVRQPEIFLFDEPLSNLDAPLRVEMRMELKRLHQKLRTTTVYVTHDQEEAMTLGDRVAVMAEGVIRQCDSPLNLYSCPADTFVASFLGAPPMSLLAGTVVFNGNEPFFRGNGVILPLCAQHSSVLRGRAGATLLLGIPCEAAVLISVEQPNAIAVSVEMTEILGSQMNVHLRTGGGESLVVRAPASELANGASMWLSVEATKCHVFEDGTDTRPPEGDLSRYGRNLTSNAAAPPANY